MNANLKKYIGVLMTLAVITAGSGAVAAAPGSIDTTATDTNTTVYMADEKTIQTNYSANGSVDYALPILNATGAANSDLAMNVTKDGVEYYSFSGTWDTYASGEIDTSTDYIHNVSGDELGDVPMNINQNVSLNVTYWNESAANPTPTTIQVYIENGDERSVQRVTESASFAEVEETEQPIYRRGPFGDADEYTTVSVDDTVKVNGSNTTVIYTLSTNNVSEAFANTTEDVEDAGAFTFMMSSVDADEENPIPVFYKSSPDWYEPGDMGTYAVYSPTEDTITFHTEDAEFKGVNQGDFMVTSDVYRVTDAYTVWKLSGGASGSGLDAVTDMVM